MARALAVRSPLVPRATGRSVGLQTKLSLDVLSCAAVGCRRRQSPFDALPPPPPPFVARQGQPVTTREGERRSKEQERKAFATRSNLRARHDGRKSRQVALQPTTFRPIL